MNTRKSVPKQKDFKLVLPLTPGLLRGAPLCPVPSSAAPQGVGTPRSRHPEEQAPQGSGCVRIVLSGWQGEARFAG